MRSCYVAISSVLVGCLLIGCDDNSNSPNPSERDPSQPYTIVTTCGMVTDIVRQVAGEHARVVGLMNEGVDPHMYKPTRDDMNTLFDADIVFYVGLKLEGRMTDSFVAVSRSGIPVYPVTEGLDREKLQEPPEFEGHYDPHVWMDVSLWSECVAFVAKKLIEFDPAHTDDYQANTEAYRAQLAELHEYTRSSIDTIPKASQVLTTAHDAFGYFSDAYGIPVKALQGITTEAEASVDDVNQLVSFLVERKIGAIFVESSVNQEGIKALLEGCQSRGHKVVIGGELFSDAMGASGSYTGTYVGMMDHNATTITRALGGEAPKDGFRGKLKTAE